ncbi:MAG: RhuM family protein [Betaproteobacteria bacterium]|nr:RhuM family protein [Betaproteobacteria bacterium]
MRRQIKHYSPDAIISVGYRVNSRHAVQPRRWEPPRCAITWFKATVTAARTRAARRFVGARRPACRR